MIKGLIVTNKRGKIGWNEGRERSPAQCSKFLS